MKTAKRHKGFTLIELIIVIAIVGLLAGLAVPKFIGIARDAQVSALMQDIDTLEKVIPVYYTKHEEYPLYMDNVITFKNDSPLFLALQKNGESGDNLYKINLDKSKRYHSKLKYGKTGKNEDYYIYSMETGRVYYAKGVFNKNGQLIFGYDIQTNNILRNLTLSDIPVIFNQTIETQNIEHILVGEVLIDETVEITHNGQPVPVQYEDIVFQPKLTNIYAANKKYKRFTASLLMNTSQPNKITIATSKGTETFTVNVNPFQQKPIAVITMTPEHDLTTVTKITWGHENSITYHGTAIVNAEWENKQDVYTEEGVYTVKLRVKDSNGVWSDWAEKTFYVFPERKIKQFAAGTYHSVALMGDGTVWTWGDNGSGQLGDQTDKDRNKPVQVKNLSNVKQVTTGYYFTLALLEDGTVRTWGHNSSGQLGDGTTTNRNSPVQVPNISHVKQVAAGYYHSLALKEDGTVWSWGSNAYGQLGDGTTKDKKNPIQIPNLADVKQVAAGGRHSLALKNDGTVWAWGLNSSGQLGDGTTKNRSVPVQVKNLSNVKQISAGISHSLALLEDGTVMAWGFNGNGRLGDGTTMQRSVPVPVQNLSNVLQISAGQYHNLALLNDGTVWSWGKNTDGQLGDGTTKDKHAPVQISGLIHANQVTAGDSHSLALSEDGTLWAWGGNNYGQLGDATTSNRTKPVPI